MSNQKISFENGDFTKQIQWSPDDEVLLALTSEQSHFYVYQKSDSQLQLLYDYACSSFISHFQWFPFMTLQNEESACFLACGKDLPIHLYHINGYKRASYSCLNEQQELTSPLYLKFSQDGNWFLASADRYLYYHDLQVPKAQQLFYKFQHKISAFSQPMDDVTQIGTFEGQIFQLDLRQMDAVPLYLDPEKRKSAIMQIEQTDKLIITTLRDFTNDNLIIYDKRNSSQPLFSLHREMKTAQRLWFDLDADFIYFGDCLGKVYKLSLSDFTSETLIDESFDSANCLTLNRKGELAVSTGQRQFDEFEAFQAFQGIYIKQLNQ